VALAHRIPNEPTPEVELWIRNLAQSLTRSFLNGQRVIVIDEIRAQSKPVALALLAEILLHLPQQSRQDLTALAFATIGKK